MFALNAVKILFLIYEFGYKNKSSRKYKNLFSASL